MNNMEILRGDIFYIKKNGYTVEGSEQEAGRPALIVSNNEANKFSRSVSVVYLTTQEKKPLPTHCEVIARSKSTALCEGVTTVSKDRLLDYVRTCTEEEMKRIDECMMLALGLPAFDDGGTNNVEAEEKLEEMKIDLDIALKNADFYKDECEKAQALCKNAVEANEKLIAEIREMEGKMKQPAEFTAAEYYRLSAERDLYKEQAEKLFEKLLDK